VGEGVRGPHPEAKYHRCGFKNVGLLPSKLPKMVTFGINLHLKENPWGPYRNLNVGAQLQTFLYVMTPKLSLKITLHHSISIITNFVIPKRDKRKHDTFWSTAGT